MPAVNVEFKGPLFSELKNPEHIRTAERQLTKRLVEMGQERLASLARPRPGGVYLSVTQARRGQASTGHYRRSIVGETRAGMGRIHDSGVVYGPWLEGTSSRNATSRFKGYAMFRRTSIWLQRQVRFEGERIAARLARILGGGAV